MVAGALAAIDPSRLVARALQEPHPLLSAGALHVIAAGKAAPGMARAFADHRGYSIAHLLFAGAAPPRLEGMSVDAHDGVHPVPDVRSVRAGSAALALAAAPGAAGVVVLLSGGASSMLAVPAAGVSLAAKQAATRTLLAAGVDIRALNCVRKHLSAIKGGRLAAASVPPLLALAISDVAGDDPGVIASGPTVADPTTYAEALAVLDGADGRGAYPREVVDHLERGARGGIDETPKPGDPRMSRAETRVIGGARDAVAGARQAAEARGYTVIVRDEPVAGEARHAAALHTADLRALGRRHAAPLCVLSSGETTVRVRGSGRGGRNQEYALASALSLPTLDRATVVSSIGTDGVDGPTDAAGAVADTSTLERARARGLEAMQYLDANDAWTFFDILGDLVRTGATGTNVGDLQVALVAPAGPQPRQEAL